MCTDKELKMLKWLPNHSDEVGRGPRLKSKAPRPIVKSSNIILTCRSWIMQSYIKNKCRWSFSYLLKNTRSKGSTSVQHVLKSIGKSLSFFIRQMVSCLRRLSMSNLSLYREKKVPTFPSTHENPGRVIGGYSFSVITLLCFWGTNSARDSH